MRVGREAGVRESDQWKMDAGKLCAAQPAVQDMAGLVQRHHQQPREGGSGKHQQGLKKPVQTSASYSSHCRIVTNRKSVTTSTAAESQELMG